MDHFTAFAVVRVKVARGIDLGIVLRCINVVAAEVAMQPLDITALRSRIRQHGRT